MRHSLRMVWVTLLGSVAWACDNSDKPSLGTVTVSPPVGVRAPAPGDPSCPRTGQWQPCALVDRVVHAGLSFKATDDSMRVPFLPVPGVRYRVAVTDTLLAFFFADSTALRKALMRLDTVRMAPLGDSVTPWPSTPIVIRSANLLALYFAENERQIERLRLAITAGAPIAGASPASSRRPSPDRD
ncbi:MAG: hypothetical protein ABMA00_08220 [Gemmatimonas sp.]